MRTFTASVCGHDMKALRGGTFISAIPHVMAYIVPRQMVTDGDPNRRCCEQSEAIGVDLKFDLHKRCARNHTTKRVTRNARGEIVKEWRAKLRISRVMQVPTRPFARPRPRLRSHALMGSHGARAQVFNRSCLRENLRRDEASTVYLQRRDHRIKRTGKSVAEPRKKSSDEHENTQPRYAAATAVAVQIKERRALGDLQPRTSRER